MHNNMTFKHKLKQRAELPNILEKHRKNGQKIVLTNGCFDILHLGHVSYLEEAKALGDVLVVAVNSDASVKSYKTPDRPYNQETDRAFVLAALESVDYVFIFDETLPTCNIKICKPDIFVKGGDYTKETLPEYDTVIDMGGEVRFITFTNGYSTTKILNKVKKQ